MKPAAFTYRRADSVAGAIGMLAEYGDGAKLLAGGQSLGPMLNFRMVQPTHLIDIRRIEQLRDITTRADGSIWIGAAVTHAAIEDGATGHALLARVAGGIAYRAVRNRGTLGGSLVQADPAADWPVVMTALAARAHIVSAAGERVVPMAEFFVSQLQTVLMPGEVLLGIELPAPEADVSIGFCKIAPKSGEFADSIAVVALRRTAAGGLQVISAWLGAAGVIPLAVTSAETLRAGERADTWVAATLPPCETPAERYKRHLHTVSIDRAIADALAS